MKALKNLLEVVSLNATTHRYHLPTCRLYDPDGALVTLEQALVQGANTFKLCGNAS